jgi:hypothetical protein
LKAKKGAVCSSILRIMKTNNSKGNKSHNKENIIFEKVDKKLINKIAKLTGFTGRKDGKIKPYNLIIGFMIMTSKKLKSFDSWASEIAVINGISLTKQAVEERMNYKTENMLKLVFEEKLAIALKPFQWDGNGELSGKFADILIDDCTTINLPPELAEHFPGNVSRGEKKSQAKIHALHNFTKNNFLFLDIHSFVDNDQSLSSNVLSYLNPGDLILRDLGFQVLSVQRQLISNGVFLISRKKFGTKIYDEKSGKVLTLKKLLGKKGWFDGFVLVGKTEQLKMRLVVTSLPKEQANERRRKERKNRDKRMNHCQEYYNQLGYTILLTNVPSEICSRKEIGQLYGLRWRIETIFKTWKSYFSLEKIIPKECKNPHRINCVIYLMLLQIITFQIKWMNHYTKENKLKDGDRYFSLMKLAKFFSQHLYLILTSDNDEKIKMQIEKHCRYENRNDRINTMEKYEKWAA